MNYGPWGKGGEGGGIVTGRPIRRLIKAQCNGTWKKKSANSFFNSKTENLEILRKRYSQCRFSDTLRQADRSSRGVLPSARVSACHLMWSITTVTLYAYNEYVYRGRPSKKQGFTDVNKKTPGITCHHVTQILSTPSYPICLWSVLILTLINNN